MPHSACQRLRVIASESSNMQPPLHVGGCTKDQFLCIDIYICCKCMLSIAHKHCQHGNQYRPAFLLYKFFEFLHRLFHDFSLPLIDYSIFPNFTIILSSITRIYPSYGYTGIVRLSSRASAISSLSLRVFRLFGVISSVRTSG